MSLRTRVATGAVGGGLFIVLVTLPVRIGDVLVGTTIVATLIAGVATCEAVLMMAKGRRPILAAMTGIGVAAIVLATVGFGEAVMMLLLIPLGVALVLLPLDLRVAVGTFFMFYVPYAMIRFLQVRDGENGLAIALVFVAAIWVGDSAAYFVGRSYGRHALAPRVSPHKTVEGFFAGVGSTGVVFAVGAIAVGVPPFPAVITGTAIAAASPLGDLLESWLKRMHGVKDAGGVLPGHGGALDRFDSMFLAAIVMSRALEMVGVAR